jgi:hypothetical protein
MPDHWQEGVGIHDSSLRQCVGNLKDGIRNLFADRRQRCDGHDRDEHENECILDESLAAFVPRAGGKSCDYSDQ